jgi:hypothetical protein
MRALALSVLVMCSLCGNVVHAQWPFESERFALAAPMPPECFPRNGDSLEGWRKWLRILESGGRERHVAEEARRIGDHPDVLRYMDRLYLTLDDGKLATLIDCPAAGYISFAYSYEHFDDVGRFYVVFIGGWEGTAYGLVSRRTGSMLRAWSLPVWSPSNEHFAHGQCNLANGPCEMAIARRGNDEPVQEAAFQLPQQCTPPTVAWENPTALSVICGNQTLLRVVRRGETWQVESR